MPPKSEVQVVLSADSKSLEKAFDKVGAGAKDMARDLDKAEDDAKQFGSAMERATEITGDSEGKFMGTADLLDGLGGAFGLPTEGATNLFRSFGDLSGGITTLGPMLAGLATGPVGIIAGAVAGLSLLVIALWKNSETFRDIVTGALEKVKSVAGPVFDFIGGAISTVMGWFGLGGDASGTFADEQEADAERAKEAWDDWNKNVTAELDDLINPLNRARDNSKVALDDIKKNLDDNVNFYSGWINNLKNLTERGFGELALYLYSLGPTAEKAVGEAYKLTDPALQRLSDNIVGKLGKAGAAAQEALQNGIGGADYESLGKTIGERIVGGMRSGLLIKEPMPIGSLVPMPGGGLGIAGPGYVTPDPNSLSPVIPNRSANGLLTGAAPAPGGTVVNVNVAGSVITENQLIDSVRDGLIRKGRTVPLGLG